MEQITDFFQKLFNPAGFPARWHCGLWTEFHGWLYIISDLMVWAAYMVIPFFLINLIRKKKDTPFSLVFLLFGAFILLCGFTHLVDVMMFWFPIYRFNALVRLATGIVSWFTIGALFKFFPQILALKTGNEFDAELAARKIVEEKLKESEEQFRLIVENVKDYGMILLDVNGNIKSWNAGAKKIKGYSRDEIIGKHISVFYPEEEIKNNEPNKNLKIAKEKGHLETQGWRVRKDGSQFFADIVYAAIYDETNNLKGYSKIIRDITERKKVEERLKASEEKFKGLLESAPDAIVIAGKDGKISMINNQTEKIFGFTKDELIGKEVELLIPQRFQKHHPEHRNKFMEDPKVRGMGVGLQLFGKRKNGEEFPVEISLSPLQTSDGLIVSAAIRDITERKKAEEEIRQTNKFLDSILENIPNMIFVKDAKELRFVRFNKAGEKLLGYSQKDLIGKNDYDFFPKEEADFFTAKDHEVINKKTIFDIPEEPIETKSGKRWLHTQKITITDEKNNPLYLLGISEDITERKKAEKQLERYTAELENKNKEIEQFAFLASHDLQEPLRTVANYVSLFEEEYKNKLDKTSDEYLKFITGGTQRMQMLINDLLQYSRIGREKSIAEIDCNKVLNEVMKDMTSSIEESKAEIKFEQLPVITGHYSEMKSLFQNLLSNAIKYRKKNTQLIINITVQSKPNEWLFAIKDNGIGIDKIYFDKLFKIFQRLHNKEEYPGTGIGLAQCKKIVELHGGKIWIESELDKGSTFYFTISKTITK